jgi:phage terminase large subunit
VADIDVWLPRKLHFLREPHRYKVLYGGRGGIKSWSIAQSLLVQGTERDLSIPCARETMQSIRESVHQLLEDQIQRLGMQGEYEVQRAEIKHRHRNTSFTFHSLRDQSVHNIKSLEGADILWVEEAQNVSKKSWRTVIPTIRKPGSEIWISFNPELETDDTYQRS